MRLFVISLTLEVNPISTKMVAQQENSEVIGLDHLNRVYFLYQKDVVSLHGK